MRLVGLMGMGKLNKAVTSTRGTCALGVALGYGVASRSGLVLTDISLATMPLTPGSTGTVTTTPSMSDYEVRQMSCLSSAPESPDPTAHLEDTTPLPYQPYRLGPRTLQLLARIK